MMRMVGKLSPPLSAVDDNMVDEGSDGRQFIVNIQPNHEGKR